MVVDELLIAGFSLLTSCFTNIMVYSRKRPIQTRKRGKLMKAVEAVSDGLTTGEEDEYEVESILEHKR